MDLIKHGGPNYSRVKGKARRGRGEQNQQTTSRSSPEKFPYEQNVTLVEKKKNE